MLHACIRASVVNVDMAAAHTLGPAYLTLMACLTSSQAVGLCEGLNR